MSEIAIGWVVDCPRKCGHESVLHESVLGESVLGDAAGRSSDRFTVAVPGKTHPGNGAQHGARTHDPENLSVIVSDFVQQQQQWRVQPLMMM